MKGHYQTEAHLKDEQNKQQSRVLLDFNSMSINLCARYHHHNEQFSPKLIKIETCTYVFKELKVEVVECELTVSTVREY